jgi:hypothetical protein
LTSLTLPSISASLSSSQHASAQPRRGITTGDAQQPPAQSSTEETNLAGGDAERPPQHPSGSPSEQASDSSQHDALQAAAAGVEGGAS